MNFPNYSLNCSGNFSQIGSGALSSVSVKRKAKESKTENQEEKTTGLAGLRFNGSCIEELPSKRREVVERDQKGKEKIESDALSDVSKEKEIDTTDELWDVLEECLPTMESESYFSFEGSLVHKDIIKELLKYKKELSENQPKDFLDRLYACQTILCEKDNQEIMITGFEKILLEQKSPVLKLLFEDNRFQEANSQNSISWAIDQKIFGIFLKSLYQPNILLDEQKELNEEEKEKIFIDLLDQANQWEIEKLKGYLISWFQKKLSLLDKREDEDLAKVVEWHIFARSRELTSLQKSCEDFLIKSFLAAEDDQEKQRLIKTLKMIQMTQLDVSTYLDVLTYLDYKGNAYLKKFVDLIKELSLTELNLGSWLGLMDDHLALLKDLPLKKLTIVRGDCITDRGLMHFKNMPLEELSLQRGDLTDKSFIYLQGFKNLRVLDLTKSKITGTGLIDLKDLPLQTLILDGCDHLRGEYMTHLKNFTNLQRLHLDMYNGGVGKKNFLTSLADLPNLRILHLVIPRDVDRLAHLKKLPLEELELNYKNHVIGSHDLENLEGLPLRKLSLRSWQGIEDAALIPLKKLQFLRELEIEDLSYNNSLTNAGVAHLGDLFSLKTLRLKGGELTGDCLIHLQNLFHLEELYYDVHTIKGGDLGNLEGLLLRKLSLRCWRNIENGALIHLKKLHLEELEIKFFLINNRMNAHIAQLGDLSSLKKLTLKDANLTADSWIHLQKLPHLEEFSYNLSIEDEDLFDLKQKLPLLKINKLPLYC